MLEVNQVSVSLFVRLLNVPQRLRTQTRARCFLRHIRRRNVFAFRSRFLHFAKELDVNRWHSSALIGALHSRPPLRVLSNGDPQFPHRRFVVTVIFVRIAQKPAEGLRIGASRGSLP
jgi:hypothetical protein